MTGYLIDLGVMHVREASIGVNSKRALTIVRSALW